MSKKLLTDDLILEKLKDKGIEEPGTLDVVTMVDVLQEYYDCKIITGDWPSYADHWFYTSSTVDSYDVYVSASHDGNPSLYDEVYYYESGWLDELSECITYGNTVYVDSTAEDSYEYAEQLEKAYEEYWNDEKQKVEDELIDEGYEWEDE